MDEQKQDEAAFEAWLAQKKNHVVLAMLPLEEQARVVWHARDEEIATLRARLAEAEAREQALRKALEQYADTANWCDGEVIWDGEGGCCGYDLARDTLAAARPATDPRRGVGEADLLFQQPSGAEPARPDAGGEERA